MFWSQTYETKWLIKLFKVCKLCACTSKWLLLSININFIIGVWQSLRYYARSWLPARSIVADCVADRKESNKSGEILIIKQYCPVSYFELHIFLDINLVFDTIWFSTVVGFLSLKVFMMLTVEGAPDRAWKGVERGSNYQICTLWGTTTLLVVFFWLICMQASLNVEALL